MIVTEFYITRDDGVDLVRTYSDRGKMIHKVGTSELYSEAIDVSPLQFTYEETEDDIPAEEIPPSDIEDMRQALEILGVSSE